MKKQALIILGLVVIISGALGTTVYAGGDGELPPINIPSEDVSVNPDAYTKTPSENVTSDDSGILPTADGKYDISGIPFEEITETTSVSKVKRPKKTKIKKLIKGKKRFTVKWKKVSGINGYQIQYSTKKNFKKKYRKTVTVKKAKITKKTIKKLKAKKKYYVRVRTYKLVNGKRVYSKWSAKKTVKTK